MRRILRCVWAGVGEPFEFGGRRGILGCMKRSVLVISMLFGVLGMAYGAEETAGDRRIFADGLMSRHLFARAAVEYEALLRDFPSIEGKDAVLFRWAEALRETKRVAEADGVYARVLAECKESEFREMSLYKRGTLAKEAGRADEAIAFFRQILSEGAEGEMRESVLYFLAETLLTEDRVGEAIEQFEVVLKESATGAYGPYAKLSLGVALARRDGAGDYARAVGFFKESMNGGRADIASDALYRWGESAFRKGAYAESAGAFEELLKRYPQSKQAKECALLAALSEDRANRPEAALAMAERALSQEGVAHRDEWLYLKGRALFQLDKNAEAAEAFLSVINDFEASPYTVSAGYECALAYGKMKRYEDALMMYRMVPAKHALRARALRGAGLSAKALGRMEEAITHFRDLDATYPEDEFAEATLAELAYLVQQAERWSEAGSLHRRFAERFPKSERAVTALYAAGICYREAKELEKALEAWGALVSGYPEDKLRPETLYLMGEMEMSRGKWKEALAHFDAYLACKEEATDRRAEALYCRGSILVREGRLEEALEAIVAAKAKNPSDEVGRKIRYHEWLVLQKLNRLDGAADALDALLQDSVTAEWLDPRDIGWAPEHQLSRKKPAEAKRVAHWIVKKAPDDGWRQEAWYWVGRAEAERGDAAAAEAAFRAATDLKVETNRAADAYYRVGEYRYAVKDYVAAERIFEKAMSLAQAQGVDAIRVRANIGLARSWRELGRKTEAARQFLGLCMLYQDDTLIPPLIEETIPLLRELGQIEEAKALERDLAAMKSGK